MGNSCPLWWKKNGSANQSPTVQPTPSLGQPMNEKQQPLASLDPKRTLPEVQTPLGPAISDPRLAEGETPNAPSVPNQPLTEGQPPQAPPAPNQPLTEREPPKEPPLSKFQFTEGQLPEVLMHVQPTPVSQQPLMEEEPHKVLPASNHSLTEAQPSKALPLSKQPLIEGKVLPKAPAALGQQVAEGKPSEARAPPPPPRPRKRAVLCGVAYKNSKYELTGTINDVKNMKNFLINKFGFPEDNMRILTDGTLTFREQYDKISEEEENQDQIPIKRNIIKALRWLVEGCCSGDSLVFYFAGHGLQQPDLDNEERDRMNEAICPTDFQKEGLILDNEINTIIVWPLKKGVTLHAIIDSCHSGTMLDLLYVYNRNTKQWDDNSPLSGVRKSTDGGLAISISACEDREEAVDTSLFTGDNMNGALTYILIKKVSESTQLTYGELLDSIHEAIEDFRIDGCLQTTNILKRMFGTKKLSQKPQLSASERFGVYSKHFRL